MKPIEEMSKEEIKLELPQQLSAAVIQSAFRPPFQSPEHDDFCGKAYNILGHTEYSKIYTAWERQFKHR